MTWIVGMIRFQKFTFQNLFSIKLYNNKNKYIQER